MPDSDETNRRLSRRIAIAAVKHMSDAKWRKLFSTLHSLQQPLGGIGFKFINDDRLFTGPIPGPEFAHADNTGECGGISYQPFAHIEFLLIPYTYSTSPYGPRYPTIEMQNDIDSLLICLGKRGAFPIQRIENGVKIVAYEWGDSSENA